jgi:hypothetical protein
VTIPKGFVDSYNYELLPSSFLCSHSVLLLLIYFCLAFFGDTGVELGLELGRQAFCHFSHTLFALVIFQVGSCVYVQTGLLTTILLISTSLGLQVWATMPFLPSLPSLPSLSSLPSFPLPPWSHCVAQAGLEFVNLLPQFPEC